MLKQQQRQLQKPQTPSRDKVQAEQKFISYFVCIHKAKGGASLLRPGFAAQEYAAETLLCGGHSVLPPPGFLPWPPFSSSLPVRRSSCHQLLAKTKNPHPNRSFPLGVERFLFTEINARKLGHDQQQRSKTPGYALETNSVQ